MYWLYRLTNAACPRQGGEGFTHREAFTDLHNLTLELRH